MLGDEIQAMFRWHPKHYVKRPKIDYGFLITTVPIQVTVWGIVIVGVYIDFMRSIPDDARHGSFPQHNNRLMVYTTPTTCEVSLAN